MSTPPTAAQHSAGAKILASLLIGAFLGAMITLVAMQALQQKSGYVDGLMAVLQHHHVELRKQVHRGRCDEASAELALQRLRQLGPDIATALASHGPLVQAMTDDLNRALQMQGPICEALPRTVSAVDAACKACHSQLR